MQSEDELSEVKREVNVLSKCVHENITRYHGCYVDDVVCACCWNTARLLRNHHVYLCSVAASAVAVHLVIYELCVVLPSADRVSLCASAIVARTIAHSIRTLWSWSRVRHSHRRCCHLSVSAGSFLHSIASRTALPVHVHLLHSTHSFVHPSPTC